LFEFAKPLPVTYHRAFDEASDLHQALEDVTQSGAKRILTSGGAKSALDGAAVLANLSKPRGNGSSLCRVQELVLSIFWKLRDEQRRASFTPA